jgi:hypothetical protein
MRCERRGRRRRSSSRPITNAISTSSTTKGITLTPGQEAWYVKKLGTQKDEMKREFPATVEEAFEASIEGAYLAEQMAKVRRDGPHLPVPVERSPVDTFWDLGVNDDMVIWFRQKIGPEHRFIDYYSNSGEGLEHYARILKESAPTPRAISTAPTICRMTATPAGCPIRPRPSSRC